MTRKHNNGRHFSTKSIRVLADNLDSQVPAIAVDSVLQTLAQIDQEIHSDFNQVRSDLASERERHAATCKELETAKAHAQNLEHRLNELMIKYKNTTASANRNQYYHQQNDGPSMTLLNTCCDCHRSRVKQDTDGEEALFDTTDHAPACSLRRAFLSGTTSPQLVDLLLAREDACRNQAVLIKRLKLDNAQLRETYDDVCARYQHLVEEQQRRAPQRERDRLETLSVRLQRAGQVACDVAARVEERLKITARDVSNFRRSVSVSQTSSAFPNPLPPLSLDDGENAMNIRMNTKNNRSSSAKSNCNEFSQNENNGRNMNTSQSPTSSPASTISSPQTCHIRSPSLSVRAAPPSLSRTILVRDEYENDSEDLEACLQREMTEEHYRKATDELMRTMALQQEAHAKLRATVDELTAELSRIDPQAIADVKKHREEAQKANEKLKKRDAEILDLRRQLTKVLAEYEAISVAHSYSNAELSRIRAKSRKEKTAGNGFAHSNGSGGNVQDHREHRSYPHGHTVLDNVDNKHHRKIHFR